MKAILLLFVLLFSQNVCFSQNLDNDVDSETDTFFVWEELNLEHAENTGFVYQECNFINMLLESVQLGIIRPSTDDSLQTKFGCITNCRMFFCH